jgi:hypothetical protein
MVRNNNLPINRPNPDGDDFISNGKSAGTWQNSDGGVKEVPTNITRITRALLNTAADGTPQIVYYQSGVGCGGTIDKIIGGIFCPFPPYSSLPFSNPLQEVPARASASTSGKPMAF